MGSKPSNTFKFSTVRVLTNAFRISTHPSAEGVGRFPDQIIRFCPNKTISLPPSSGTLSGLWD
jgi:hypothetical protein